MNDLIKLASKLIHDVDSVISRLSIERFFQSLVGHQSSQQVTSAELDQLYAALFFLTGLMDEIPFDDRNLASVVNRVAEAFEDLSILRKEPFVVDSLPMLAYSAINYAAIDKNANASVLSKDSPLLHQVTWQSFGSMATIYQWLISCILLMTASDFQRLNKLSEIEVRKKELQTLIDNLKESYQEITSSILLIDSLHSFSSYMITGQPEDYKKAVLRLSEANELASVNSLLCEFVFYLGVLYPRIVRTQSLSLLRKFNGSLPQEYFSVLLGKRNAIYQIWPSQLRALEQGLLKYDAFSISLPTSAGKTFLAELKIASSVSNEDNTLAFYVVPLNALAKQVKKDLEARLRRAPLNLFIKVLTGAYEIGDEELELAGRQENVIITTPEKLDGLLRNIDNPQISAIFDRCRLFIFDECHNISEGNRGITYELLIARILDMFPTIKILTLSAVFENIDDMAKWIGKDNVAFLKDDWRPTGSHWALWPNTEETVEDPDVPEGRRQKGLIYDDQWEITDYLRTNNTKADLARVAIDLQKAYENVLILANRRATAESYAYYITQSILRSDNKLLSGEDQKNLKQIASYIRARIHPSSRLAEIVENGVAYHHAHLPSDIKSRIEDYIASGTLKIVVSTTTLAQGMNFPIRCIIIPSIYISGKAMSPLQLKNTIGRAGRARVSTSGLAVIFKSSDWVRYEDKWKSFKEYCFNPPANILKVKSSLYGLKDENPTIDYYESLEAIDSQILAFLGQSGLNIDNQAEYIADRTFLKVLDSDDGAGIVETLNKRMTVMTQGEGPLLEKGSPYVLTTYGDVVRKTGYGTSSSNLLRQRLEEILDRESSFFTSVRSGAVLDKSKIKEFLMTCFTPIDNLTRSFALKQKIKKTFGVSITNVKENVDAFTSQIQNNPEAKHVLGTILEEGDIEFLWSWINGGSHEELSNFFLGEKKETLNRIDERIIESIHFIEEIYPILSWTTYTVLNILKYLIAEREIPTFSRELDNIPTYIRYGVNHPIAVFVLDKLKWQNRREALLLSSDLPGELSYFEDREQLKHTLLSIGEKGLSNKIDNAVNAHEIWLRLTR